MGFEKREREWEGKKEKTNYREDTIQKDKGTRWSKVEGYGWTHWSRPPQSFLSAPATRNGQKTPDPASAVLLHTSACYFNSGDKKSRRERGVVPAGYEYWRTKGGGWRACLNLLRFCAHTFLDAHEVKCGEVGLQCLAFCLFLVIILSSLSFRIFSFLSD